MAATDTQLLTPAPHRRRIRQIDTIKGLAILGVLLNHSLPTQVRLAVWGDLTIFQPVPVFIVVMGLTSGLSFAANSRADGRFIEAYDRRYWLSRFNRLGIPFLLASAASLLIGLAAKAVIPTYHLNLGLFTVVGMMPGGGPGSFFVTLALAFAVLGPAIWWVFSRWPRLSLAASVVAALGFEVMSATRPAFLEAHSYLYDANPIKYLPAYLLGMWLVGGFGVKDRRNRWLVVAGVVEAALLILAQMLPSLGSHIFGPPLSYTVFGFFYSALLVCLAIAYIPNKAGPLGAKVDRLGEASWHIFLVQIIVFGPLGTIVFAYTPAIALAQGWLAALRALVEITLSVVLGLAFQRVSAPLSVKPRPDTPT